MDAVASIIKSTMVNLTELKKLQMAFGFVFALDIDIIVWGSLTIIVCRTLVLRNKAYEVY
jgi:hypothetical protein